MSEAVAKQVSLRRRLMVIALVTSAVTLAVFSAVLIARDALEWRARTVNDLQTYGAIIGSNAAPAVMFDDVNAASDTLSALSAKRSIVYGIIYNSQGHPFAEYRTAGIGTGKPDPAPTEAGAVITLHTLALSTPILFKGRNLGWLVLKSDLDEMYGQLARDAGLIVFGALCAFWAGSVLMLRLQKAIIQPIQRLASAMHDMSGRERYDLRVPVTGNDEVGVLSQAFNAMLDRIQRRDAELAEHRNRLEGDVATRTAELELANAALQRSSQQVDLLSQMAATLQTCLEQEEVANVVTPFIRRLFPNAGGAIYLLKSSRNLVESAASWGSEPGTVFAPNDCWAIRRGALHVCDASMTSPRCAHAEKSGCTACAPMMAQGELMGIVHLQSLTEADAVTHVLLQRVAGEIAQALANLRYREALKRMAIRDSLTGLFNRRYLEEYLEMEIARSTRKGTQLALALLDIDHFKNFNDSFGHEAGDEILRAVGQLFMRQTREGDVACRYGGEEFVIAMWECTQESARERLDLLRAEVKALSLHVGQRAIGTVTLSAGVALFPNDGATGEEVLRAADRALYTAKLNGRDRVCIAGAVTPP